MKAKRKKKFFIAFVTDRREWKRERIRERETGRVLINQYLQTKLQNWDTTSTAQKTELTSNRKKRDYNTKKSCNILCSNKPAHFAILQVYKSTKQPVLHIYIYHDAFCTGFCCSWIFLTS